MTDSRNRGDPTIGAAGRHSYKTQCRPGNVGDSSRYRGDDVSTTVDDKNTYVSDTTGQQKNEGNKKEFPVSFEELGITCSIKKRMITYVHVRKQSWRVFEVQYLVFKCNYFELHNI